VLYNSKKRCTAVDGNDRSLGKGRCNDPTFLMTRIRLEGFNEMS